MFHTTPTSESASTKAVEGPAGHDPAAEIAVRVMELVEQWVTLSKAVALYPSSNSRVRASVERFLQGLAAYRTRPERTDAAVRLIFTGGQVLVDDQRVDPKGSTSYEWLKTRLDYAGLAGLCFEPGVGIDSMVAFTRRLLDIQNRELRSQSLNVTFDHTYAGIELIDRRFEGHFRVSDDGASGTVRSWGSSGTELLDTSEEAQIGNLLASDPVIAESLKRLSEIFEHGGGTGESNASPNSSDSVHVDLLGRLVRLLPADGRNDAQASIGIIRKSLELFERRARESGTETAKSLLKTDMLIEVMMAAGLGFFGRQGLSPTEMVRLVSVAEDPATAELALPGKGHEGDEKVADDADALCLEVQALPQMSMKKLTESDLEDPTELCGTYLHLLVQSSTSELSSHVRDTLVALYSEWDEMRSRALSAYLPPEHEGEEAKEADVRELVIGFFTTHQRSSALRRQGILSERVISESFPHRFGLYLDAIDVGNEQDTNELRRLLQSIGQTGIQEAEDILLHEEGLLEPERVTKLLSCGGTEILPLVRLMLEHSDDHVKAVVVDYLRGLNLDSPASRLLWLIDDPAYLSSDVLLGVVDLACGQEPGNDFQHRIGATICRFIESSANNPEQLPRRVYAVKNLVSWPTDEGRLLLTRLLNDRAYLVIPKEPRAIRKSAREVLKTWRRRTNA